MGCTTSRPGRVNSELSSDCNDLMTANISLFRIIECLHIQNHKLSSALYTLYIKKQAEQFYNIIKNYRNFWLSEAKSSTTESQLLKKLEICEKEQLKELSQLKFCNNTLLKIISDIYPDWHESYNSVSEFLEDLELSPSITQVSTTLYGNFYLASNKEIKAGLSQFSRIPESDKKVFRLLKSVALEPYKKDKDCVYFTDKIVINSKNRKYIQSVPLSPLSKNDSMISSKNRRPKIKNLNIDIPITPQNDTRNFPKISPHHRSNSSKYQPVDLVENENPEPEVKQVSIVKPTSTEKEDRQVAESHRKKSNLSSADSEKNTKNENLKSIEIDSEINSSSFDSDEDEEYLARLSYSQK